MEVRYTLRLEKRNLTREDWMDLVTSYARQSPEDYSIEVVDASDRTVWENDPDNTPDISLYEVLDILQSLSPNGKICDSEKVEMLEAIRRLRGE